MMKSSLIALVTAATIAGALPAVAAAPFGDGDADSREWRAETILVRLQDKGVNATAVEEWGSLVRAYVEQPDGTEVMQFFTPDTLTPVAL